MPATWLVSDTHFGHEKTCSEFKREDGSPLRPFSCAEEMDEFMVKEWNERVGPHDKVYHLGDVAIARKSISTMSRLNGDKVLIRGNHDIFELSDYTKYFRDVRAYHVIKHHGIVMSHVPIHLQSLERWKCNVHGHLHANEVTTFNAYPGNGTKPDSRYLNVCVEHTGYAPILFDDVLKRINQRQDLYR